MTSDGNALSSDDPPPEQLHMELRPGTHVSDNVRLVRKLAEGAMGEVWVADHLTLQLEVAVKMIAKKLADSDPELRERLAHEAATAAKIKSAHVVQTHDLGVTDDGTPFIVMELLEGESLADRLQRLGSLTLPETAQVVVQVSRALNRAHKLGIEHRDIKPENIYLSHSVDDGLVVKVFDFGIATHTQLPESNWDETDTMTGTPQYLSPERFKGDAAIDGQSDLWALAVVAYRCLTARFPFSGETIGLLSVNVLSSNHVPPSSARRDLPPAIDEWFARCFAPSKANRFATAKDLATALMRLIPPSDQMEDIWSQTGFDATQSGTMLAPDTFSPTRVAAHRPWARPALGGALLTLIVVIIVALVAFGSSHEESPASPAASAAPQTPPTGPPPSSRTQDGAPSERGEPQLPGHSGAQEDQTDGGAAADPSGAASSQHPIRPPPRSWPRKRPGGGEDYGF